MSELPQNVCEIPVPEAFNKSMNFFGDVESIQILFV